MRCPLKFLFVILALFGDPGGSVDETRLSVETVQAVAEAVQTGSIIASRGDCLAVRVYTNSPYTHVGAVVVHDGHAMVYDSMIRIGVRCQPLDEYLESQRPCDIELFRPTEHFTQDQARDFKKYLDEQVGRPYAIHQYVTGREVQGLHCAQYLTCALVASGHIRSGNPARVSPAEILRCLARDELYAAGDKTDLPPVPEPVPERATTWYGRAWQDTQSCSHSCWVQSSRWVIAK
jgi:hypothetical protein